MMRLILLLLFLMVRPAYAQTVTVTSGDHSDFTRLVLTLPAATDWSLARTPDGYAFRVAGAQPRYDLGDVFARITRNRLASIWADPEDGSLRLGVGCPCHALPFEFRPGTVVIDVKDGQPPPGSSFEQTLNGEVLPALVATSPPRPRPRLTQAPVPFEWHRLSLETSAPDADPDPMPLPRLPDPNLLALREDLLEEFSRAASEGLIEPTVPQSPPPFAQSRSSPDQINLRLGDPVDARTGLTVQRDLAADGGNCPSDSSLALSDWGDARPVSVQMAEAMANLTGEFDRPDPASVSRAVRFFLHLGFGAEAGALLAALPVDHPDTPLWRSLARLVDGDEDPGGAFSQMAACDGAAALWAALANPSLSVAEINTRAVIRAFSSLPPHLRRSLGPDLAEGFLTKGDLTTATALHEMLSRLPGPADPRALILDSRMSSAYGAAPEATEALQAVLDDPGPAQLEALVTLVELHAAEARPLDPAQADALAAFLPQVEDTPMQPAVARAHILALALTERFDEAFAHLPSSPETGADLWRLLSTGPDNALLHHAIGARTDAAPPSVREVIAGRLRDLGFPQEAAVWQPSLSVDRDPGPEINDAAGRSAIRARDWEAVGQNAPEPWQALVSRLAPEAIPDSASLSNGRALTAASAETRAAISELLETLPKP